MAGIGSVNFGGMASGLDTNQIMDDLMRVEAQPLTRLQRQQSESQNTRDTFTSMKSSLLDLQAKASELKTATSFGAFSASSSLEEALVANATTSASEGNFSIEILQLAQAETLSSNSYSTINTDLGLSGEIVFNATSVSVRSTDSLMDIRNGINALNDGISASILKVSDNDNRLIITSSQQGTDGFIIGNVGADDVLGALGFVDDSSSVREVENGSVMSQTLSSANSTIGSLLDLSVEAAGTVSIRNQSLSIDLSTDSLTGIRDKINDLALSGVTAIVETISDDDITSYRLAISGTEDFTDNNSVLETLGILERGNTGTYGRFASASLIESAKNGDTVDSQSKLSYMGAEDGETITISGTNVDGTSVSSSITIDKSMRISDVLSEIESTFNGNVSASVSEGKIEVTSTVAGANKLSFGLSAENELGGQLDFGSMTTVEMGRDRLLSEGLDSKLVVNNIELSRRTNEINDAITGLNLSLRDAEVGTTINITVERDRETIKGKIEAFTESYNSYIDFFNANSKYDSDTKTAGPLLGDITARTVQSNLENVLRGSVSDGSMTYNQLTQIGIETSTDGKLEIDSAKLNDALNDDIDSLIELFTANRKSSDNDVIFVYHTEKTRAGSYDVSITQSAEIAETESSVIHGATATEGTLSISDNYGRELSIEYTKNMSLDDIANSINDEAETAYVEMKNSDTALLTNGGQVATQSSTIEDLAAVAITTGDTINIQATDHDGREFERIIALDEGDVTIQDILDAVEDMNDQQLIASIDSQGKIQIEDRDTGTSNIALSFSSTVANLNFGTFSSVQQGRSSVIITAEVTDDSTLKISQKEFGASKAFTVSGVSALGINDGTYAGLDIEGTINGVAGTGNGQSLTASTSDENTRGIIIRSAITAAELAVEGPSQGSITLVSGIAEALYSKLVTMTSSVDGFIQSKIDSIDLSINSLDDRMDNMNSRLAQTRERLQRRFTQLEMAMSRLQSLQATLNSSLGAL